MSLQWQISAAELFEFVRPATWALAALLSACVLLSARRQRFPLYVVAASTLGTLFFPLITLPLYVLARAFLKRRRSSAAASARWTYLLVAVYLTAVLSVIALFFYSDYESLDAHLWRANNAKLRGPHSKVIAEYRAALRLEDDPHTHKLLAVELMADKFYEEALAEFQAAERGGEADARLPYRMAEALVGLGREQEAAAQYKRFLNGPLCTAPLPDADCATARSSISTIESRRTQ